MYVYSRKLKKVMMKKVLWKLYWNHMTRNLRNKGRLWQSAWLMFWESQVQSAGDACNIYFELSEFWYDSNLWEEVLHVRHCKMVVIMLLGLNPPSSKKQSHISRKEHRFKGLLDQITYHVKFTLEEMRCYVMQETRHRNTLPCNAPGVWPCWSASHSRCIGFDP